MSIRVQALFLVIAILLSAFVARIAMPWIQAGSAQTNERGLIAINSTRTPIGEQRASLIRPVDTSPVRNWNVLDPQVDAAGALVQFLDADYALFRYNSYTQWPIASISKLLTAVVVLEKLGSDKKIPISQTAVDTEGTAGDLRSGEVYTSEDLLKIMLLSSSNDAATAFEEYAGGREVFAGQLNAKARQLGMDRTAFQDASGLSDQNQSNANDLMKLVRYIAENHPDLFAWSRLPSIRVQPLNTIEVKTIDNVNPMVARKEFLGGKTGTSPAARENLVAIFSLFNQRIVLVLLGSHDRVAVTTTLLQWIQNAYSF